MWPGVYREDSRVYYRRRGVPPRGRTSGPVALARIVETDSARTLTVYRVKTLARIVETDTARTLTVFRMFEPVAIVETDSARALTFTQVPSGQALTPALIVEVAFSAGASTGQYLTIGDSTRGLIDTGLIAPDATGALGGVWTDVTEHVRSWSVRRGSTRVDSPVVRYEPGSATIVLDNSDRRFDPTNVGGPYVEDEATQVTPMRAVRIRAVWADVTYAIFQGFADQWDVSWMDPGDSEATLTCTDAMKVLAGQRRTAGGAAGAGDLAGARVTRVLDSAGWSDGDRMIGTGTVTMMATTLDGDPLAELQLVADTEIGELYVDAAGRVVFRDRASRTGDERSALSQATFGDDGDELPYTQLGISYDDQTFFNQVKATRTPVDEVDIPVEQTASDATSQALYMTRTYERSDLLMQTDGVALSWAQYIVARSAEPELRFERIEIDPRQQPGDLYPHVLGRDFGDRITVTRRPPGGGNPIVRDQWIRGVEHAGAEGEWSTAWVLQAADEGDAPAPSLARSDLMVRRRLAAHRRDEMFRRPRRSAPLGLVRR